MKHFAYLALAACLGLAQSVVSAEAVEWKAYTYVDSVVTPAYRGLEKLSADYEKETGGAITIKPNAGGSLPIKASNITQAVADGVLQIADDFSFVGNLRIGGLIRLPSLIENETEYAQAREIWLKYVDQELDAMGVKRLSDYHYPAQVFFSSQKMTSLEDIKGRKIRVSSAEQGEVIKRLGGTAVTLSPPEVPTGLQSGVVSGVLTASAGGGLQWRDFFTHNYRLGVNWTNSMFIVNKSVWNKLTPDQQAKLNKVAKDAAAAIETELRTTEDSSTEKFKATGMVITLPTAEEKAKAVAAISDYWEAWAKQKGGKAPEALAAIRAAIKR
ncbi:MAG: TRAP transporter substrate-binding protein DctP [Hyphomicrobiaceae bacterium]|jgi:TRAP-type C4-dicarboxylate transport system substrate-binding protein